MDEKLEDPVDPVQAMLQHMIPHLESKPTRSVDTLLKDDKPEADTNPSPKKKKKVSYKDIAGELLKDCFLRAPSYHPYVEAPPNVLQANRALIN
ncbi:hypothetical protein FXO38_29004 [Capsicum annuum]|nr:hypothetical protein FXO38_29004 [Capsicum annuum]